MNLKLAVLTAMISMSAQARELKKEPKKEATCVFCPGENQICKDYEKTHELKKDQPKIKVCEKPKLPDVKEP